MLTKHGVSKLWAAHSDTALRIIVAFMAANAILRLGDGVLRLVRRMDRPGAIDLRFRYSEVHAWFAGIPVYGEFGNAVYPPATYTLLWSLLGWLPLESARMLWLAISVAALGWTAYILQRESGAHSLLGRAFVVLLLLGINQTGVALGNGQLILLVLPPLLIGIFLIQRGRGTWTEDLLAASCLTFALIKITITAPFLWLALLLPVVSVSGDGESKGWRLRPAVLVAVAYGGLTLLAAHFQQQSLRALLTEWLTLVPTASGGGYAEVHSLLDALGWRDLKLPASALLFLALGAWTYRYRSVDLWLRIGVAALIARFWVYHRLYDDVLVVLALVALFRIALARTLTGEDQRGGRAVAAWALLAVATFFIFLPARLQMWPAPWYLIFNVGNALSWLAVLVFLCHEAELERTGQMGYTRTPSGIDPNRRSTFLERTPTTTEPPPVTRLMTWKVGRDRSRRTDSEDHEVAVACIASGHAMRASERIASNRRTIA